MILRALAMIAAAVAILLLVGAGPGTRADLWDFRTGLGLIRWAAYAGLAGAVLALIALAVTRPRGVGLWILLATLVVVGAAVVLPWRWSQQAKRVPPIHDITTDTQDPPELVAVLQHRSNAVNPGAYCGDSVAALQRQAYPDIRPLHLGAPPNTAFARALATAGTMGWQIVATDSAAGVIEATATTRWFGFKDDVVIRIRPEAEGSRVIRIRPEAEGSRVDVRSVSRVGKSDLGTNAERVRTFLARLASDIESR